MSDLCMEYGSTEYVKIDFTTAPANIASYAVEMSIVPLGASAATGDWLMAEWVSGASPPASRLLVGPDGDLALTRGSYTVRARVTATPEKPILKSGSMRIT